MRSIRKAAGFGDISDFVFSRDQHSFGVFDANLGEVAVQTHPGCPLEQIAEISRVQVYHVGHGLYRYPLGIVHGNVADDLRNAEVAGEQRIFVNKQFHKLMED